MTRLMIGAGFSGGAPKDPGYGWNKDHFESSVTRGWFSIDYRTYPDRAVLVDFDFSGPQEELEEPRRRPDRAISREATVDLHRIFRLWLGGMYMKDILVPACYRSLLVPSIESKGFVAQDLEAVLATDVVPKGQQPAYRHGNEERNLHFYKELRIPENR